MAHTYITNYVRRERQLRDFDARSSESSRNIDAARNMRLRDLNLRLSADDLEADPSLERDYPDLVRDLRERNDQNITVSHDTHTSTLRMAPTIHEQPIVGVFVDQSRPLSSQSYESGAAASTEENEMSEIPSDYSSHDRLSTASAIPSVTAVPYTPGVRYIPFAPSTSATIHHETSERNNIGNPSTTINQQSWDPEIEKIARLRSNVSCCSLVDALILIILPFYERLFRPFSRFVCVLLLLCPVCGYYGARGLVARRVAIYFSFTIMMSIRHTVQLCVIAANFHARFGSEDLVVVSIFLLEALFVTRIVGMFYFEIFQMERSRVLRVLIQIHFQRGIYHRNLNRQYDTRQNMHSQVTPEAEVTWSRQASHHLGGTLDEEQHVGVQLAQLDSSSAATFENRHLQEHQQNHRQRQQLEGQ